MLIHATKPLFAWDELEDSPSLRTVREFLEALPDGKLLEGLRAARGRGRDDYLVRVLWGVVVLSIVLRHEHIRGCLWGRSRRRSAAHCASEGECPA
jgi:hypothetical protein